MRIMFSVPSYWPSQNGVANITRYLAEGLAARGHEILIFTSSGNGGREKLPDTEECRLSVGQVSIERIRVYVRWPLRLKGWDKESTKKKYVNRIMTFQPDILVVVCTQTWTFDWLIPYLDKIKCSKVFYSHGYSGWKDDYSYIKELEKRNILGVLEIFLKKRYARNLYKFIAKYDLAVYLSKENDAAKYADMHQLKNGKVLENAIDDIFFDTKIRHEYLEKTHDEISYLFVANYNQNKNQEMLLKAFFNANIGKSRLIFAGYEENEYLNYLKTYAREYEGESTKKRVEFNVHLTREQIIELYKASDIFVCPSKSESYPIVAHEAAAVAMPIISTDVGIYGEIEGVYIVSDIYDMREGIEKLYYNAEERQRRGEAAFHWLNTKHCRIKDKVDWLENECKQLALKRG